MSAELGDQAGNADGQEKSEYDQLVAQVSWEGCLGTVAESKQNMVLQDCDLDLFIDDP